MSVYPLPMAHGSSRREAADDDERCALLKEGWIVLPGGAESAVAPIMPVVAPKRRGRPPKVTHDGA